VGCGEGGENNKSLRKVQRQDESANETTDEAPREGGGGLGGTDGTGREKSGDTLGKDGLGGRASQEKKKAVRGSGTPTLIAENTTYQKGNKERRKLKMRAPAIQPLVGGGGRNLNNG